MQIVRGNPTAEELAALVVVLSLVQQVPSGTSSHNSSSDRFTDAWRHGAPEVGTRHWREWSSGWRDVTPRTGRPVQRSERSWTRLVG